MSYRFAKITTFYTAYLDNYYSRNPDVVNFPYEKQQAHLMADAFGWSNYFEVHLKQQGVDAHEIVTNALPLQKKWAEERGVSGRSLDEILICQLKSLQPDVVLFQDTSNHNGDWISFVKTQVPSIKQVLGWCCFPYTDEELKRFRVFDYMLTCTPGFVSDFTRSGLRSYLIYHAFERSLIPRIEENNNFPEVDFLFIGSLMPAKGFHNIRKEIIEQLLNAQVDLRIHTSLQETSAFTVLLKQGAYSAATLLKLLRAENYFRTIPGLRKALGWKEMPRAARYSVALRNSIREPLFGLEMMKALARAKIGFNIHVDAAGKYAGNIRLFEVTGAGSCLVTDWKQNLHELFDIDKEIVTYSSAPECLEKVTWLLNHPAKRKAIAAAGRARTLSHHSFEVRSRQLNAIIEENFK